MWIICLDPVSAKRVSKKEKVGDLKINGNEWCTSAQEWKNLNIVDEKCLMIGKHVSQKRNETIDNCQWYKMLLNFTL